MEKDVSGAVQIESLNRVQVKFSKSYHSIQLKACLNTTCITYRTVKQRHVSVLYPDRHQACIKQWGKGKNCMLRYTLYYEIS